MKAPLKIWQVKPRVSEWLALLLIAYVAFVHAPAANAQVAGKRQTKTLLQTKVHLTLGETTLPKVLAELSKQTGLHIQAADYLQERELLVELDNMSAAEVLDALAEANDWIWHEDRPSEILVSRPKFDKTPQLLNVAPAFRAIVPKDLRRFVGVDLSDTEIREAFRTAMADSDFVTNTPGIINSRARLFLLPAMLNVPVKAQEHEMISWVTDEVRTGKKIPYEKLTPQQQHTLLVYFVMTAMHTTFDPGIHGAANLIQGLDPAGVDENRMRILMQNGTIFIGILEGGRFSLGEQILSVQRLPDPMLLHTPL